MTRERFKSDGLHALFSVAARIEEVWPLLRAPDPFEADAIWRKSP